MMDPIVQDINAIASATRTPRDIYIDSLRALARGDAPPDAQALIAKAVQDLNETGRRVSLEDIEAHLQHFRDEIAAGEALTQADEELTRHRSYDEIGRDIAQAEAELEAIIRDHPLTIRKHRLEDEHDARKKANDHRLSADIRLSQTKQKTSAIAYELRPPSYRPGIR